jgi:hypothetical protein
MENFPGWTVAFELLYRQEQSRHASGRTRVKDFGTPIWTATYQSRQLRPNEVDEWRARLNKLQNGLETFRAWPTSRCWPIAHPNGVDAVNGTVASVGVDNKSITITWTGGTTILSVGDYLEINGNRLHQVTDLRAGGVKGLAPYLSAGILVGQTVRVNSPGVLMTVVPGSISTQSALNGRGTVSFRAMEARG